MTGEAIGGLAEAWRGAVAVGTATATAMVVVGWALPGVDMVGPRPGARIAALVPQLEVVALFLVGLPRWVHALAAGRSESYRRALTVTSRGAGTAVWRAAHRQLLALAVPLAGGAAVWVVVSLVAGRPTLADVGAVRMLLLAFAAFGIGLAALAAIVAPDRGVAVAACIAVVLAMALTPLAIAPVVSVGGGWPPLVQACLFLNPWIVVAGASGLDLLHMQWLYALSPLGAIETFYPAPIPAAVLYGVAALLLLALARRALRARVA